MKKFVFLLFFSIPLHCLSQDNKNHYQLSKDGKWYEKPVVYIRGSFKILKKPSAGEVIFITKNNKFIHQLRNHKSYTLNKENLKELCIYSPTQLYEIESKEYEKRASEIQKEIGTKPIPPISHKILRIFIINKNEGKLCAYEVNWI